MNALYPPLREKLENVSATGATLSPNECAHILHIADRYDNLREASEEMLRALRGLLDKAGAK